MSELNIALDVGHSSIGWAVLETNRLIELKGCGTVIFRADDCLASARRAYRRQRRHIRSTRQRIARMKVLLDHLGVLNREQLDKPGCAWPWLLAAQVLTCGKMLTWPELWDVLRWYAHNRGYDGNRRWSAAEVEAGKEDSEKEANARTLMDRYGTTSMAETFCAMSGIDPKGRKRSTCLPGDKRPKGQNAAFPRLVVEREVRKILRAHIGKLQNLDSALERALLGLDNRDKAAWQSIPCPDLKLPKRYEGALLFGQLVPRFDNRIISKCPVSGQKVPSRNCPEFLRFRWGMLLANIRVARLGEKELSALNIAERNQLDTLMRAEGGMGTEQFKKAVRQIAGAIRDNLETMFMHPDAKDALLLDPIQKLLQSSEIKAFWRQLPAQLQKRARGQLRRGKTLTLANLREQLGKLSPSPAEFDAEVTKQLDALNIKGRKKDKQVTREDFLNRNYSVKRLDQRAAYSRAILKKAYDEVMAGQHPQEGGCLFVTDKMREAQLTRQIAEQTNNHLVRHRLLILERLMGDIVSEFAGGNKERVSKITIEVNRDLRQMSGMTAKEKAQDLGLRLANHHNVAKKLEEDESLVKILHRNGTKVTAGLIRKARIADDLDWTCPYTGQRFEPVDLVSKRVDKDHIVPRSDRSSDSLDSLVITYCAINKWKGKRTALQFVEQEQGKPVPDLPNLTIMSLARYKQLIEGLDTFRGHDDDKRRKKKRQQLLLLPSYEEKEFTPRDLTTTSQLVRLGAMALKKLFVGFKEQPNIVSLPGSVTGSVRKAWKVLGCLSLSSARVLDENGDVRKKDDIRDITHLHHALDACVLALASHFIPNNGQIWTLIVKRRWTPAEVKMLLALGVFSRDSENRLQMRDLDNSIKEQIRQRLAEKRVVQHIPARMDGLRVEQNTWRVIAANGSEATIQQRIRQSDGSRPVKQAREKTTKLLGLAPESGNGKLRANKGVLVIPDNYGVALDPQPAIIPYHKVWMRLKEISKANGGKMPRVLRNGQLLIVPEGKFKGIWRVFSAKNNAAGLALDIGQPDVVKLQNKTDGHKINVLLSSLLKAKMAVADAPLTGIPCMTP
jgi:CRISPR-associated endonuclease Csn1